MLLNYSLITSLLVALFFLNGLYNLSFQFLKREKFEIEKSFLLNSLFFCFIVHSISIFAYVYSLHFKISPFVFQIVSTLIILYGFYKPYYLRQLIKHILQKKNYLEKILLLFLFCIFFISFAPPTDSDSLDYHLTIPIYTLLKSKFYITKVWLTSQLAGSGEALQIFSVSVGSIHFSQILQAFSLIMIILNIINLKIVSKKNDEVKIIISLVILTIPAFLFLITSSKPQLFPILTNFLCFLATLFVLPKIKKKIVKNYIFLLCLYFFFQLKVNFHFIYHHH